ncbi:hypothetical protein SRABI05_02898 [Agrobacterium fabrum]|uniref:restriction endonuclease subunit S n=1 Tax=Agrobacterium fabrum TaxID=1176649 RepID=UPI001D45D77F|nr:restriction endonuclease subunit S [Agrobacterium fabrum]CAH0247515.1 hypothetical protein SRABI46_03134 [Agrobacterium fabrum]CAH0247621.1 hypothetical protein SRABI05_02898 [Agrobacterium fabrum]
MTLDAYPAYDSYKDSGVDWIGQIPNSWDQVANKRLFRLRKTQVGKRSSEYDLLSLTLRGIIKRDMDSSKGKFPAEFDTYQEVRPGDFVFCHFDVEETPRTVGLSAFDGMITGAYTVYELKAEADANFLFYFYLNADTDKKMRGLYKGLRNTIPKESFGSFKTPLPPFPKQRAIAAFLDEKCAKVDEAVRIKEEQIALLRERRQILIQQAVTRGLNPDVPLQDSGIDWIGQIPAHWEVRRSKYVFTQRKELARKDDIQLSATQSYGVIPQDKFEELVGRRVVKIQTNLEKRKHVEIDDFVISMRSFQGGLERAFATGCIRSSYVILQPLEPLSADFFGYLLKSPRYIKALQATGSFIRDGQDLNFDNFSKVDLFLPPMDEQLAIAAYIKVGCEKIDNGIAIKEQQIVALREYRTSLIDATVTGKIKVA